MNSHMKIIFIVILVLIVGVGVWYFATQNTNTSITTGTTSNTNISTTTNSSINTNAVIENTCFDSDGGKDFFQKGIATGITENGGDTWREYRWEDKCYTHTGGEGGCEFGTEGTNVWEIYCSESHFATEDLHP